MKFANYVIVLKQKKRHKLNFQSVIYTVKSGKSIGSDRRKKTST
jgi:sRNA-binding regulator protein Hfq